MGAPLKPLAKSFYNKPTLELAKALLGRIFVRHLDGERLAGRIVETEAYHQEGDASCHAGRGKTPRNSVMFEEAGRLYVYFTYGMYYCLNVVSEEAGVGAAVLIRAIEPLEGLETMRRLRPKAKNDIGLANGPAKFCQAFAIDKTQNGCILTAPPVFIAAGKPIAPQNIVETTRIGISQSVELPWRFYEKDNPFVSKPAL